MSPRLVPPEASRPPVGAKKVLGRPGDFLELQRPAVQAGQEFAGELLLGQLKDFSC